jgi:hypothetical protein
MRRRRRKTILLIPAILFIAASVSILYFRALEFTISSRELLVDEISRATGKKTFARSVRFDLIKGLVLDGIVIYDSKNVIVRAREVSCGLIIPSLISRRVIVPAVTIESPRVNAERRPDGSFNLLELVPKGYVSKSGMVVSVHKVVIRRGRIDLVDRMLDPAFKTSLTGVEAEAKLYLPVRITFKSFFAVPAQTNIRISGEYILPTDALTADISSRSLSPEDFAPYSRASGFRFPSGTVSVRAALSARGGILDADIKAETKNFSAAKDKMKAKIDCGVSARLQYRFKERKLDYSGAIDIRRIDIDGIEGIGRIENVKARADFDPMRMSVTDIKADVIGLPWDAKVNIVDFANPIVDIYAHSAVRLSALQETLKSHFGMKLPTEIAGKGDVRLVMQTEPGKPAKVSGYLSVSDATADLGKGNFPIEHITGELRFDPKELKWQGINCSYRGVEYNASGNLSNFTSPRVQLDLASKDLRYTSVFSMKEKTILLRALDGRYLNSKFSTTGDISLEDPAVIYADLKGTFSLDLADLRKMPQGSAGLRKMKLAGRVNADFELTGDIKEPASCYMNAKVKAKKMSACGLTFDDVTIALLQEQGVGHIKSMRSSFYGGTISVTARVDWLGKGMPYSANLDAIGVKLERLKEDTGFKDKDVSGDIKVYADMKGVLKDASRTSGIGHLGLAKGRLWQLNLFKGAGTLIFSSDFSDVVFTSGACDYKVSGNTFFIDNLVMKSDLLTLYGSGRIGSDRSVEGMIRPEIPLDATSSGSFASAVGKGTVIEISGTLKEPRFKTKTNVVDVVGAMLQPE